MSERSERINECSERISEFSVMMPRDGMRRSGVLA